MIAFSPLAAGVGAPNCRAPVVVANLPVALAAEGVKQLQERLRMGMSPGCSTKP